MVSNISTLPVTTQTSYVADYIVPDTSKKTLVIVSSDFIREHFPNFPVPDDNYPELNGQTTLNQLTTLTQRHGNIKNYAPVYCTHHDGNKWGFLKGTGTGKGRKTVTTKFTDHLLVEKVKVTAEDFLSAIRTKFEYPSVPNIATLPAGPLSLCYKLSILPQPTGEYALSYNNAHILIPWHFFPKDYLSKRGGEDSEFLNQPIEKQLNIFTERHPNDPVYLLQRKTKEELVFTNVKGDEHPEVSIATDFHGTPENVIGIACRALSEKDPLTKSGLKIARMTKEQFSSLLPDKSQSKAPKTFLPEACERVNPEERDEIYKEMIPTNDKLAKSYCNHFTEFTKGVHLLSTESLASALMIIAYARTDNISQNSLLNNLYYFLQYVESISKQLKNTPSQAEEHIKLLETASENFKKSLPPFEKPVTETQELTKSQKKRQRKKNQLLPRELEFHHSIADFFSNLLKQDQKVEMITQLFNHQLINIYDHYMNDKGQDYAIRNSLIIRAQYLTAMVNIYMDTIYKKAANETILELQQVGKTLEKVNTALEKEQYEEALQAAKELPNLPFIKSITDSIEKKEAPTLSRDQFFNIRLVIQMLDIQKILHLLLEGEEAH